MRRGGKKGNKRKRKRKKKKGGRRGRGKREGEGEEEEEEGEIDGVDREEQETHYSQPSTPTLQQDFQPCP